MFDDIPIVLTSPLATSTFQVQYKRDEMLPLSLATVMAAWARSGRYNRPLFATAAGQLAALLPDVKPSTLVKALWACGVVSHLDGPLFASSLPLLERCAPQLPVDDACRALWALAAVQAGGAPGAAGAARALCRRLLAAYNELSGAQLAALGWSAWRLRLSDRDVLDTLCQAAQFRLDEVHDDDVVPLYAALVHLGCKDGGAFEALLPRMSAALPAAATPVLCMAAAATLARLRAAAAVRSSGPAAAGSAPASEAATLMLQRSVQLLTRKLQRQRMRLWELLPLLQALAAAPVACRPLQLAGARWLQPKLATLSTAALLATLEAYGRPGAGFLPGLVRLVQAALEERRSCMSPQQLCAMLRIAAVLPQDAAATAPGRHSDGSGLCFVVFPSPGQRCKAVLLVYAAKLV